MDKVFKEVNGVFRRPNIISSLLWLTGITGVVAAAFSLTNDWRGHFAFFLFLTCAISAIFAYCYWSKKDPDRLQSEEFLTRKQELGLIANKSNSDVQMLSSRAQIIDAIHEKADSTDQS